MRSKLLALLIALLPLQLCWAAVAPYVHDDARGAAHVAGLHGVGILQPQESLFDVGLVHKTVLDPLQQSDASGADLDCDVCHSHNSGYLQPSIMATIAAVHESFGAIAFALKPPPAPLRPERPQWFALA